MNEPLHPLTLSEILDRTAQLYRSRFLVFLGIATIPAGVIFVFAVGVFAFFAWAGSNAKHGAGISDTLVWTFLIVLLILVIPAGLAASAFGEGAMCDAAARFFLGETITIRNAYKSAWKRGWRYLALYALQALLVVVAPAVLFFAAMVFMIAKKVSGVASNDPSPVFGGLIFLLFVVLGAFAVWMLLRVCLAFPTCVVEQTTAWQGLKRGTGLSNGTRSRIFLLYLLGLVLNQILAWAVTIPVLIALTLVPGLQGQAHAQTVGVIAMFLIYGSMFVVRALTKPIYGIALTLFYFDQRIRREGFDIEWMMLQAGMVAATAPEPTPKAAISAPAEEEQTVMTVPAPEIATTTGGVVEAISIQSSVLADNPEESKA